MGIPAVVKLTIGQDALANGHMLLREISGFLAIALHTGAALAQQPTTFGANLFAPSLPVGREIDAERGLPITPFYRAPALVSTRKKWCARIRRIYAVSDDLFNGITEVIRAKK